MNGLYSHEVSKFEISQCVGMSKRNDGGATHSSLNYLLMTGRSVDTTPKWHPLGKPPWLAARLIIWAWSVIEFFQIRWLLIGY